MFNHRRKIIGKSLYYITENRGYYIVNELYNGIKRARSSYNHYRIDDALEELNCISREQYYTDTLQFTI